MKNNQIASLLLCLAAVGCASTNTAFDRLKSATAAPIVPNAETGVAMPSAFANVSALSVAKTTNDPILQALLDQIPDAPDVLIANARLKTAQAQLDAARAGLLPSLSSTNSVSTGSAAGASGTSSISIGSNLQVPIDLFSANRTRANAVRLHAEEAVFNKERTLALTRATLSQLYVSLRSAQAQTAVTKANLEGAEDSLKLARTRQRAGLETGLGVAQATSNRDSIAARLPSFQQAEIAARFGIEALLGQTPNLQQATLTPTRVIPRFAITKLDLSPSQWLVSRADLRAAARRLEAAGLNEQAAKRDKFPNLSLNALLNQTEASRGPTGLAGSISVNLLSTLFDFGRLDALARVAGAQAETEAGLYRQIVFNALGDVETQASRVNRAQAAIDANSATVVSTQDQAALARVRYTSGLTSFLDVLTAQRAVYDAQTAQVQSTSEAASAEIALNLALGF